MYFILSVKVPSSQELYTNRGTKYFIKINFNYSLLQDDNGIIYILYFAVIFKNV